MAADEAKKRAEVLDQSHLAGFGGRQAAVNQVVPFQLNYTLFYLKIIKKGQNSYQKYGNV